MLEAGSPVVWEGGANGAVGCHGFPSIPASVVDAPCRSLLRVVLSAVPGREALVGQHTAGIVLAPSFLEVARVVGKRIGPSERAALDPDAWEGAWDNALGPLDGVLRGLLRRAGIKPGTGVMLWYHATTGTIEAFSVPDRGEDAVHAAERALIKAAPFPLSENPSSITILGRDHAGADRRTHVLGVAEQNRSAEVLVDWIGRSGCEAAGLAPLAAVALGDAVRRVLGSSDARNGAVLHVGEHATAMGAGGGGRLALARSLPFGFDELVGAVMRGGSEEREPLGRAGARERLFRIGLACERHDPGRSGFDTATASSAPTWAVLQRYIAEIRQTLRFGLSERESADIGLTLTGPGAEIPGLAGALKSYLDVPVSVDAWRGSGAGHAGTASDGVAIVPTGAGGCNRLLPRSALDRRSARSVRRYCRAGVLSAVLALAADAAMTMRATARASADLEVSVSRLRLAAEQGELRARARSLNDAASAAQAVLRDAAGPRADWVVLLAEVSRVTPEQIRLTEFTLTKQGGRPGARLCGLAFWGSDGSQDADGLIRAYAGSLARCPLAESVELAGTGPTRSSGRRATAFVLDLGLVAIPPDDLSSVGDGGVR